MSGVQRGNMRYATADERHIDLSVLAPPTTTQQPLQHLSRTLAVYYDMPPSPSKKNRNTPFFHPYAKPAGRADARRETSNKESNPPQSRDALVRRLNSVMCRYSTIHGELKRQQTTHQLPRDVRLRALQDQLCTVLNKLTNAKEDEKRKQEDIEELNELHKKTINEMRTAEERTRESAYGGNGSEPGAGSARPHGFDHRFDQSFSSHLDDEQSRPGTVSESAAEKMFSEYQSRWKAIKERKGKQIRLADLPWPILEHHEGSPAEITEDQVKAFFLHPEHPRREHFRNLITDELRRWHPDRFARLAESMLPPAHRSVAMDACKCITRCLLNLLAEAKIDG